MEDGTITRLHDHNLLLTFGLDLSFIEENSQFCDAMAKLCGTEWQIFKKSIIRSVPAGSCLNG